MRNKKIVLACAVIMGIGSYFAYRETSKDLSFENGQQQDEKQEAPLEQKSSPKKIPHFVAGRKALVEKAEKVYGPHEPEAIDPKDMPLAKKIEVIPLSSKQNIHFPSVKASFASDLYACSALECSSAGSVMTANGFHIFKTASPTFKNDKSKALVTYDKENKQYGIWERRVIIETSSMIDLNRKLTKMKFESIERPQPLLIIAEYGGELEMLDGYLNELKSTADVKDVRLEITYSRNRPN